MPGSWFGDESNTNKENIYVKVQNKKHSGGYFHPTVTTSKIQIHQLIMDFPDYSKRLFVDHINRNTLDNRRSNLRIVSDKESAKNRSFDNAKWKTNINNSTGYPGVSWIKRDKAWMAYIHVGKKMYNLGCYRNKINAVIARINGEVEYWGKIKSKKYLDPTGNYK